jgi:hypothetical protein
MPWQSLKSIIPKTIEKAGIAEQVTAQRVLDLAAKTLMQRWGDEMASNVSFISFRRGVLQAVSSSAAAVQVLKTERIDFINTLNYSLGKRAIIKIDIKIQGY